MTGAQEEFGVTISVRKGVPHLKVTGAVDDDAAPRLEHLLARLMGADMRSVVLDMTRTSQISWTAQRTVTDALEVLRREGGCAEVHHTRGRLP